MRCIYRADHRRGSLFNCLRFYEGYIDPFSCGGNFTSQSSTTKLYSITADRPGSRRRLRGLQDRLKRWAGLTPSRV